MKIEKKSEMPARLTLAFLFPLGPFFFFPLDCFFIRCRGGLFVTTSRLLPVVFPSENKFVRLSATSS